MTAYLTAAHPDLKAIGNAARSDHGHLAEDPQGRGQEARRLEVGGIDLGPDVIAGIKAGYVVASFDQVL